MEDFLQVVMGRSGLPDDGGAWTGGGVAPLVGRKAALRDAVVRLAGWWAVVIWGPAENVLGY